MVLSLNDDFENVFKSDSYSVSSKQSPEYQTHSFNVLRTGLHQGTKKIYDRKKSHFYMCQF